MILKNGKRMDTVLDNLPIGTINCFGSSVAPTGWLICDGSAISRTIYSELFSVIGTTYGTGDGSTTFNLPDYRGKIGVGYSNGDTDFGTLGKTGGEKTHKLTISEMPSHYHINNPNGFICNTLANGGPGLWSGNSGNNLGSSNSTTPTGGDQPHNNLQPYITINYIIKVYMVIPVNSSVYNALDSTSTTDALSANQGNVLNNKFNYSTTETVIGKWIDGRTLYRRVFTVTMPNSTSWSNIIALNYTNYYVVNIHGIMTNGSNTYIVPYSESGYAVSLNHSAAGYIQVLQQSLAFSNHPFTVIVEYVKNV